VALLLLATKVNAQLAGTGTIQGTVTDPTGAVIAKAAVTITETATSVKREARTDNAGIYVFPNIPAATYNVVVTAPGFETYEQTDIVLEVGSNISINPRLTVGKTDTKVEVKAGETQQLQTEDPTYKQTLDAEEISEIPLNTGAGPEIISLISLTGGAIAAPGNDFTGSKYNYQTSAFSINGGMGNSTLWRLDGADNGDYMAGGNGPFPFPEAVGEFTQESSTLGAQDGMKAGGMVNVVTKSGTNQFHGDAFEFIRNDLIDASSFYSDTHDRLHQNFYGGTIGGPVWIPKVYNGKSRLFFFAGFQRNTYDDVASNTTATVPTAANLAGDFSVQNGEPTAGIAPNPLCSTKSLTVTQLVDPITGNLIPNNIYPTAPNWNAQSLALLAYLPKIVPLKSGLDVCGGVQYAIPSEKFDKEFVTREDYNVGPKDNLYGRYFLDSYQLPAFYQKGGTNGGILVTTASANPEERWQSGTIGENHSFSSNLVNSAHVAVMRRYQTRGYNPADINACNGLNLTTIDCAVPVGLQLSASSFSMGGGTNSLAHFNDNTGVIDDDLTWVRGRHLFVIGGEYVRNQLNISNAFNGNGVFSFGTNYSAWGPYGSKTQTADNPNEGVSAVGNGQLDFLEGAQSGFSQSKQEQNALRSTIPAIYVQDTFHVTKRLTLVAGIRWDPNYQPYDVFNRGETFSLAGYVAGTHSTVYPNAPAGVFFYGDPGVPRAFTQSSPNQWDPNFGFTYDPVGDGKTIIRAGAEYMYDTANTFTSQRNQQNPPFATNISQSLNTYTPFSDPWLTNASSIPTPSAGPGALNAGTIQGNPFPGPSSFVGRPSAATAIFPKGGQYIVLPPKFHIAVYAQWNASIQHDFPHGWQVQLQYIGSKGSHEEYGLPLNGPVWIPGTANAGGTNPTCAVSITVGGTSYNTSLAAEGGTALPAPTASNPNPNCSISGNENPQRDMLELLGAAQLGSTAQGALINGGTSSLFIDDTAYSTYEAGILSVNHRLSPVFSMFANYTWSKCLDVEDNQGDVSGITGENPPYPAMDYGPCGWDLRNVLNVEIVAHSNFHLDNHLASYLINNWEIAGVSTSSSGSVVNVTAGQDDSLTGYGNDRPNLVPNVPIYQKVKFRSAGGEANREFLNPAAFAEPAVTPATSTLPLFGNISKNQFHGPPQVGFNAQISRYWPIHEGLKIDTRIEAFNVLNHPNFSTPDSKLTDGTFGQVSGTSNSPRQFQGSLKVIF
jgi:hypothetical protein